MDRLRAMSALVAVAEEGSFSAAARALHITPAAVSKQVARLEEHLGVRLVHRTTRSQALTDAGVRYVERCRTIVAEVEAADQSARAPEAEPRGTLRVTAPTFYGRVQIMPIVLDYMRCYPGVQVETLFSDVLMDLAGAGVDVAVRVASSLPDSALSGRRIGSVTRILTASPKYLAEHACLLFRGADGRSGWSFHIDGQIRIMRPRFRLLSADTEALLAATLDGAGIAALPEYRIRDSLAEGALRPVLSGFYRSSLAVWMLMPSRQLVPTRVSAFARLLEQALAQAPGQASRSTSTARD